MDAEAKRRAFKALHTAPRGFVMPNAWDAGSAAIIAAEGFAAIATTSAGVAFSMARQDYQVGAPELGLGREVMLARCAQIARATALPVNGDLEAGFGDAPEDVAETIRMAIGAGLAGGNIEDKIPLAPGLYDETLACERIAAARDAIGAAGSAFVLTARTDVLQIDPGDLKSAIRRANRLFEAGADCLFTPGVSDLESIHTLAREINGPLNMVMGLGNADNTTGALLDAGVQRISLGGSIARAAMGFVRQAARELKATGSLSFARDQIPHGELNRIFADAMARGG